MNTCALHRSLLCYAEYTTAAHLRVPALGSEHQGGPLLILNGINSRTRLEQFPGDLLEMV